MYGRRSTMSLNLRWHNVFTVNARDPLDRKQGTNWIAQCFPILACRRCILTVVGHPLSIDPYPHSSDHCPLILAPSISRWKRHFYTSSTRVYIHRSWVLIHRVWRTIYGWVSMHWVPGPPNARDHVSFNFILGSATSFTPTCTFILNDAMHRVIGMQRFVKMRASKRGVRCP